MLTKVFHQTVRSPPIRWIYNDSIYVRSGGIRNTKTWGKSSIWSGQNESWITPRWFVVVGLYINLSFTPSLTIYITHNLYYRYNISIFFFCDSVIIKCTNCENYIYNYIYIYIFLPACRKQSSINTVLKKKTQQNTCLFFHVKMSSWNCLTVSIKYEI